MFEVGYTLGRRVDCVSVAYSCLKRKGGGYILGGNGRLFERCI